LALSNLFPQHKQPINHLSFPFDFFIKPSLLQILFPSQLGIFIKDTFNFSNDITQLIAIIKPQRLTKENISPQLLDGLLSLMLIRANNKRLSTHFNILFGVYLSHINPDIAEELE